MYLQRIPQHMFLHLSNFYVLNRRQSARNFLSRYTDPVLYLNYKTFSMLCYHIPLQRRRQTKWIFVMLAGF